jgi:hypothetical protein
LRDKEIQLESAQKQLAESQATVSMLMEQIHSIQELKNLSVSEASTKAKALQATNDKIRHENG